MASVSFRIGEGSRTTTRTVNSVGASGFVVTNAALATAQIGDTVEMFSSISGNAGFYTLYGTSGTLGYYLRPAPNAQGTGGSIARLNRAGSIATAATAISGVFALSGAGNLAAVWVPGANFRSAGIKLNDRAIVSGSAVSGNWGAWFVQAIPSDELVILRPPDRGAGLASESPGTGALTFRQGLHVAKIEPVSGETLSGWDALAASGILPVSGASLFQGSGELRDYVRKVTINAGEFTRDVYLVEGLSQLQVAASGLTDVSWVCHDDVVLVMRPDPASGSGSVTGDNGGGLNISAVSGNPAEPIDVQLGATATGDRYSAVSGSAWIGVRLPAIAAATPFIKLSVWGSYFDTPQASQVVISPAASGVASLFRSNLTLASGALTESCTVYGTSLNPTGAGDHENLMVASTTATANISNAGAIIGGLLISDAVFAPIAATLFTSGPAAVLLDPRTDLDLATYFLVLLAGGSMEKRYTFNPRFVSLDAPTSDPAPISGLYVELFETDGVSESQVASGFTGADGRLNGGSGHELRRQRLDGANVLTEYAHRITTQGGGFRLESRSFTLTTRVDSDITIQRIAPDYESEFDE